MDQSEKRPKERAVGESAFGTGDAAYQSQQGKQSLGVGADVPAGGSLATGYGLTIDSTDATRQHETTPDSMLPSNGQDHRQIETST